MKFAFTTILKTSRFGWQDAPSEKARQALYRQVADMGFDGIEWSPRWFDCNALSRREIRSRCSEIHDFGLLVSAINLNRCMLTRCAKADQLFERLMRTIETAEYLRCPSVIISVGMPEPPTADRKLLTGDCIGDQEFEEISRMLKMAAIDAGPRGIGIVLELHDDGPLDSADRCLRMTRLIDQSNVSVNPDLGNFIRHARSKAAWRGTLRRLAPHTGYWHVKNYRDGQPTAIWDGDIDYRQAFSIMRNHGYDGWVSIESYFGDDVMGLQEQSLNWIRTLGEKEAG